MKHLKIPHPSFTALHLIAGLVLLLSMGLRADYYNPCGIIAGENAYFMMSLKPDSYPDANIVWHQSGTGTVSFVNGNTGRSVTVRGVTPGDITLSVQIGDAVSARPRFEARVVEETVVDVSLWIMADGTNQACSVARALTMLNKAGEVWKQVGLKFRLCECAVTNCPGMMKIVEDSEDGRHASDVFSLHGYNSSRINCYIIGQIYNQESGVVGLGGPQGIIVTPASGDRGIAHEIGHVYRLTDIYDVVSSIVVSGDANQMHTPSDWNGGTGSRYYRYRQRQSDLVRRLLMMGAKDGGMDITKGDVYGFWYETENVGLTNSTSTLRCSLAPVGFFKRFDSMGD